MRDKYGILFHSRQGSKESEIYKEQDSTPHYYFGTQEFITHSVVTSALFTYLFLEPNSKLNLEELINNALEQYNIINKYYLNDSTKIKRQPIGQNNMLNSTRSLEEVAMAIKKEIIYDLLNFENVKELDRQLLKEATIKVSSYIEVNYNTFNEYGLVHWFGILGDYKKGMTWIKDALLYDKLIYQLFKEINEKREPDITLVNNLLVEIYDILKRDDDWKNIFFTFLKAHDINETHMEKLDLLLGRKDILTESSEIKYDFQTLLLRYYGY